MPEAHSAAIPVLGERRSPTSEETRDAAILEAYAATLARSLNERSAFDAAVRLYRTHEPDRSEDDARRAVANVICRKA